MSRLAVFLAACGGGALLVAQLNQPDAVRLWHYRNLGKAFYENPTTQKEAVDQFRQALALAPDSPRELLNYGLALLRAGEIESGTAQIEKVQKLEPKLPHSWFNLGIALQKQGEFDRAFTQFQGMARLAPDDPITHYHLGTLYKLRGDQAAAIREFETARKLQPRLAAAHFQLYGIYRQAGRAADAATELQIFQDLKKQTEGAAVPEDVDWSAYSEIYDPIDGPPSAPPAAPVYRDEKIAGGFGQGPSGVVALRLDAGARPSLIAWSSERVAVFRYGTQAVRDSGLESLRDVVSIAPGDFDNDGLPDLCVITSRAALLYRNVKGKFQQQATLATGSFRKAVWIDYDHDYDPDLVLLGDDSRLLRNNGAAGFSDETRRFPFVAGRALDAALFDLEPDTPGFDLVVSYQDRPGVLYRDKLGGAYQAVTLDALPAGAAHLVARDFNRDGRTDLAFGAGLLLLNRNARLQSETALKSVVVAGSVLADFQGNGRLDRALISADGTLVIERDVTPNYGDWIEIALTGVKNEKLALNAKVEVKAGTSYEKATYEGLPLVFRLDSRAVVDTVRITWANGLVQNETGQAVNRVVSITEAPRLAGSCPMIFTWNGERFNFVTDVLGVAPLGASSGDGHYFPVDHDEYVSMAATKSA
jgi:tetratricopeptide (TPR) repeat protein